ncbi:MAG: cyanophycin synthetase [Fimbriimonadaceae bacterium]|nr:cyanophycin synthetase [Chitinophagales bacterium]
MKILSTAVMKGPNYWSIRRHKLIVMKLDLEEMEEMPTNKIPGFRERLEKLIPSLYEHRCSEDHVGGFFERVDEGTWMGHVVEHVALELQTLAGLDTGFGRTRSTSKKGIYNVVYSYLEEQTGLYAGEIGVQFCDALARGEDYDITPHIQKMKEIRERERLGPSTGSIVEEAHKRDIPYIRLNKRSLVQLGWGINQKRIQATIASTTSNIAVDIACDKEETKNLLQQLNIPVPKGASAFDEEDLKSVINRIGYPLVIKPIDGNHGRGSTMNIKNWNEAVIALKKSKEISRWAIVEQYITGYDYRLLVINYKFVSAALRKPASIVGDGKSTVKELIEEVNKDPRRGYGHENVLTSIKYDDHTIRLLEKLGMDENSIPKAGEEVCLKSTANLSTGGTATDVTEIVHPNNIFIAERIARTIGLDISGIDIMSPDISVPMNENRGVVLEVNAAPGFRMHLAPSEGIGRNVAEPVVDMLFPAGSQGRIPIVAITGTNGKTTTTRLTAHIAKTMGYKVGFTTSDGIYIQNRMLEKGDTTGPLSTRFVLMDPTVDYAVLECARGGMLKAGLGFDKCDYAIVTNVTADHLGLKDIDTVEEMAKVKSVLPETVHKNGYAILNADDELVYNMRKNLDCKVAYFSMDENNPRIKDHCKKGGIAAVLENGFITILKGTWKLRVEKVVNIPLTFDGKAIFMIQNILPATLCGFLQNFKVEEIKLALQTFIPGPATTPGRMNVFKFKNFEVLVDFAHNPDGFEAISKYLEKIPMHPKVGLIAATGDRRDDDIRELGRIAARTFDQIVIRQDKHLRGRTDMEIMNLLKEGIHEIKSDMDVVCINPEAESIKYVVDNAKKGSHITILSDVIAEALDLIMQYKERDDEFEFHKEEIPNLHQTENKGVVSA